MFHHGRQQGRFGSLEWFFERYWEWAYRRLARGKSVEEAGDPFCPKFSGSELSAHHFFGEGHFGLVVYRPGEGYRHPQQGCSRGAEEERTISTLKHRGDGPFLVVKGAKFSRNMKYLDNRVRNRTKLVHIRYLARICHPAFTNQKRKNVTALKNILQYLFCLAFFGHRSSGKPGKNGQRFHFGQRRPYWSRDVKLGYTSLPSFTRLFPWA